MKYKLIFYLSFILILSACSITKRVYNRGYLVEWHFKRKSTDQLKPAKFNSKEDTKTEYEGLSNLENNFDSSISFPLVNVRDSLSAECSVNSTIYMKGNDSQFNKEKTILRKKSIHKIRTKLKLVKSEDSKSGFTVLIIGAVLGILCGLIIIVNLHSAEFFPGLIFAVFGFIGLLIAIILILVGIIILANNAYQKDQVDNKQESKADDKGQELDNSSSETTASREEAFFFLGITGLLILGYFLFFYK